MLSLSQRTAVSGRERTDADARPVRHCTCAPAGRPGAIASPPPVAIRLADTDDQRSQARLLINRMYAWRGYGSDHVIPITPHHITFTAAHCCTTAGTITLAVDSPAGLAADTLFRAELDTFRARPGARICELTKLAFDTDEPSRAMLAALFHIVFIYGYRRHRCTDLFIEVNPRHRRFYQSMLGFDAVGPVRHHPRVDAPAQLMRLEVAEIRRHIDAFKHLDAGPIARSLYPLFFSPQEEDGIYARLEREGFFAPAGPATPRPAGSR